MDPAVIEIEANMSPTRIEIFETVPRSCPHLKRPNNTNRYRKRINDKR